MLPWGLPLRVVKNRVNKADQNTGVLFFQVIFTGLALGLQYGNVAFGRDYVNTAVYVQHLLSSWESGVWGYAGQRLFS